MKGGENIGKQDILISLIVICLFILSLNMAFATNATEEVYMANNLNDSIVTNERYIKNS